MNRSALMPDTLLQSLGSD